MKTHLTRREVLALAGASVSTGMTSTSWAAAPAAPAANRAEPGPFPSGYSLNFSTIRTAEGGVVRKAEIAAKAGYQGIEPWISDLDQYVKEGGSLADLRKRIADLGLSVENAIGFFEWIVDDDQRRAKAFEEAKRNMDLVAQIGGKRLAAPPAGATESLNLLKAAERYRALLEAGDKVGVVPLLEIWGGAKAVHTLGEAMLVAVESRHPKACILPDVFHTYKGGSDFSGLRLLSGTAIGLFHVNDYPAEPPRAQITDAQRVFPGDGIAPLPSIFRDLAAIGYRGMLSLELFNREYWKQDAQVVARTGLEKMKAAVAGAGAVRSKE